MSTFPGAADPSRAPRHAAVARLCGLALMYVGAGVLGPAPLAPAMAFAMAVPWAAFEGVRIRRDGLTYTGSVPGVVWVVLGFLVLGLCLAARAWLFLGTPFPSL